MHNVSQRVYINYNEPFVKTGANIFERTSFLYATYNLVAISFQRMAASPGNTTFRLGILNPL